MADEKAVQPRRPRGTPIDRGIALMRAMDEETLRDFGQVVRGFVAGRPSKGDNGQAMLDLGERAAEDE